MNTAALHATYQENTLHVEGLICLTRLTGVANLPVRNISSPFFPHKSELVRFLSVFYVYHILSEFYLEQNFASISICRR